MADMNIEVRPVKGLMEWLRIRILYRFSFPLSERKPFAIIRRMYRKGKTDVLCAFAGGRFAGFAATINGRDKTLLDYLAVRHRFRNAGIGSAMLAHMFRLYEATGLFVEIENAFEACSNPDERKRRRNFYIKNGMEALNVFACVFGVNMELLGFRTKLDFQSYRAFYGENYSQYAADHILPCEE